MQKLTNSNNNNNSNKKRKNNNNASTQGNRVQATTVATRKYTFSQSPVFNRMIDIKCECEFPIQVIKRNGKINVLMCESTQLTMSNILTADLHGKLWTKLSNYVDNYRYMYPVRVHFWIRAIKIPLITIQTSDIAVLPSYFHNMQDVAQSMQTKGVVYLKPYDERPISVTLKIPELGSYLNPGDLLDAQPISTQGLNYFLSCVYFSHNEDTNYWQVNSDEAIPIYTVKFAITFRLIQPINQSA